MIIIILIIFFFLILRFTVTLFNFLSNPKLPRIGTHYRDKVSILVPARNEAENIIHLLNSIQQQDYPEYEVIILDDDSTDNTFEICSKFAVNDPRFKIIKGQPLPLGWTGKNYACHQLALQATGKYLLFLDADEQVERSLINSAVHRMHLRKLALLSLFTNQDMRTAGEYSVVPLMHFALLNMLPLRLILLSKFPSVAAASGQFMLFDADVYRQEQWHLQAQSDVVEDVVIMRLIKASGFRGEGLLANDMISCRMYKSYSGALNGFSKNFLAAFNYSIPALLFYIILVVGGPILVFCTADFGLIVLMVGLILLSRIMISLSSGQNPWYNLILHPFQMLNLAYTACLSIQKYLTKTIEWKGRKISA